MEQLEKNIPYQGVSYQLISPTEYTVHLKSVKDPLYLNFTENYHPQWKLRVGEFSWYDGRSNNYFLDESTHFKNQANLNSFFIDPKTICKTFTCKRNDDGSYDIEMTLYFLPQSYVYWGLIVSVATFIVVTGWLLFALGKKLYERK